MTDDICGASNRDDEPCGLPAGWGTDHPGEGRCKHHGGASSGAPEGNQNAMRHGLNSVPEYLAAHLDESQQDDLVATHEALLTRYERCHGHDPDYAASKRLRRVAIEIIKEDVADAWLAEQAAESGNLLMEHRIDTDDQGRIIDEYDVPNSVLESFTALKRETRLTLKDMGLLRDPDTKQAESVAGLTEVLSADPNTMAE
jgi:uncharacterized protein YjcR